MAAGYIRDLETGNVLSISRPEFLAEIEMENQRHIKAKKPYLIKFEIVEDEENKTASEPKKHLKSKK